MISKFTAIIARPSLFFKCL